ncbi:hypothetical protein HJG60_009983 [Phyllostomus discolor]|uniref:Uncharacterized protein n=1 Tax=Phyllostomus discolor TaxID=89673 RepID=A0A834BD26_9CHIR|nr:hypothetical protein HJG60_009983 [Phyllostomus discolor]
MPPTLRAFLSPSPAQPHGPQLGARGHGRLSWTPRQSLTGLRPSAFLKSTAPGLGPTGAPSTGHSLTLLSTARRNLSWPTLTLTDWTDASGFSSRGHGNLCAPWRVGAERGTCGWEPLSFSPSLSPREHATAEMGRGRR